MFELLRCSVALIMTPESFRCLTEAYGDVPYRLEVVTDEIIYIDYIASAEN